MKAKVVIDSALKKEMKKKFGLHKFLELSRKFQTLEDNPNKGKKIGKINNILIKEVKYDSFRFYFIVDGEKLKLISKEDLTNLLIKFVKMSKKDNEQDVINEIKEILRNMGFT